MKGKNDRFDPLGGAVSGCCTWQGIATRAKQQEKVGLLSRMSSPSVRGCTILAHWQASEKHAACSRCCWWSCHHLAWGWSLSSHCRWCRRVFKETSAVHLRCPVRTPPFRSDDEDWDSGSRRRSSTQEACSKATFFPIMVRRDHRISKLFPSELSRRAVTLPSSVQEDVMCRRRSASYRLRHPGCRARRPATSKLSFSNTEKGRLTKTTSVGTEDDFSNLNVLLQNLRCWKKKLFSFPTQQILARSVKKRRSYRSSKSSDLQTNLSPSLREKIRFDGTSGLIFHPDNGSFAYTLACHRPSYQWRMHGGAKIRRFASFRLAVLTSTGPLFWIVWTEHERTHALKDHDWNDFVKLLQWANFHGIRCSCCPSASALRVESWSTSVSWCLVRRPTDLLAQR